MSERFVKGNTVLSVSPGTHCPSAKLFYIPNNLIQKPEFIPFFLICFVNNIIFGSASFYKLR